MKNQNIEQQKPSFQKEQIENADLYKPVLKKNNDNIQIMHKMQFRNSLKC